MSSSAAWGPIGGGALLVPAKERRIGPNARLDPAEPDEPVLPSEAEESAFLAEANGRDGTVPAAPRTAELESHAGLPPLDELVARIPAEVRAALDEYFRARFTGDEARDGEGTQMISTPTAVTLSRPEAATASVTSRRATSRPGAAAARSISPIRRSHSPSISPSLQIRKRSPEL